MGSSPHLFTPAPHTWGELFDKYYADLELLAKTVLARWFPRRPLYELGQRMPGSVFGVDSKDNASTLISIFFANRIANRSRDWSSEPIAHVDNLAGYISYMLSDALRTELARYARSQKRQPYELGIDDLDTESQERHLARMPQDSPGQLEWVRDVFQSLPYDQQAAVTLLTEGVSTRSIAGRLGTSRHQTQTLVGTARKAFRSRADREGIHLRPRGPWREPHGEPMMAKTSSRRYGNDEYRLAFTLKYDGGLAARGEVPAAEFAQSLQGWDRLLHLAMHAHALGRLEPIPQGAARISELRIEGARKGSFLVNAALFLGGAAAAGIIGNGAYDLAKRGWPWAAAMLRSQVDLRRKRVTEDEAIDEIERLAREHNLRVTRNRENSERYLASVSSSLGDATALLQSSAASVQATLTEVEVPIIITQTDRSALMTPYEPPTLDPEDQGVISTAVRFIRINRRTGNGTMEFLAPKEPSQFGVQRFRCIDPMIRRRANRYTGAFHLDTPMVVKMQRKGYEQGRRGHYWLIAGLAEDQSHDNPGLFGQFEE